MPFAYYRRLSRAQRAVYRRSDAIESVPLAAPPGGERVAAVRDGLEADDRRALTTACQRLSDALTTALGVPPVVVRVLPARPSRDWGELHGLYEPGDGGSGARVTVWMRTARRRQVVAFKTFLRTLVHELCHHLDYELFDLPDSFHTEGFFQRESDLQRRLLGALEPRGRG